MQIYTKMPTPGSIGGGQTASTKLILGLTHDRIDIRCNAQIASAAKDLAAADWATVFSEFRIIANGQTKIQLSAADAVAMAQLHGYTLQAGTLPIFLTRPWLKLPGDAVHTGYGTAGLSTLVIEADIKTGQTVNLLEIYSEQSDQKPWGPHLEVHRYTVQAGVIGLLEIADLPKTPGTLLMAMHFNTDAISTLDVFSNQVQIVQTDASTRANLLTVAGLVDQVGYTSYDWLSRKILSDAVPMQVQDFRIKPNFTTAGNYSLITETFALA